MQKLVNPFIEYQDTINRDEIKRLEKQVGKKAAEIAKKIEHVEKSVQKSLEDYYFPDDENLSTVLNGMLRNGIKLSLYGEFLYYHPELYENYPGLKHWSEYLITAARSYQKIFEVANKSLEDRENYLFLLMSVAEFNNAMQHAASSTIAKDTIEFLEKYAEKESANQDIYFSLHKILLRFFEGNFIGKDENGNIIDLKKDVWSLYKNLKSTVAEKEDLTHIEVIELGCMLYMLKSINSFIDFAFSGEVEILKKSTQMAEKSVEMANIFKRADLLFFSKKIRLSIETSGQLSIWHLRKFIKVDNESQTILLNKYIRQKNNGGIYFLYPSQFEAIERGILDRKHKKSIVSMPTGAGKTLLSELVIFSEILSLGEKKGLSLYMVPSRALAREKFEDFSCFFSPFDLKVCQITGEVILDAEKAIKEYDLVILTPEKFDMIMREKFYDREISTLVIDEFHNIRSGFRGTKIEFDILRFKEKYSKTRQILISAIVSHTNFDEIAKWFESDISVYITWRPTFSRIGVYDLYNKVNRIYFDDGISIPFEKLFTKNKSGKLKISAELALKFGKDGPCMVFCRTKQDVMNIAKYFMLMANETELRSLIDIKKNEYYSKRLYRLVGDEDVYKLYRLGIGIHRSDLPHRIRKIVEEGTKKNAIRFLLATATLAEGVNLPIKTVIVPDPRVGRDEMELGFFFNLLGRAGRPFKEYEGQLILVTSENYSEEDIKRKFVYVSSKDIEKIATPIWHIVELTHKIDASADIEDIERNELAKKIHENVLETMLLALLHEYPEIVTNFSNNFDLIEKVIIGLPKDVDKERMKYAINDIFEKSEKRMIEFEVIKNHNDRISETDFGKVVYKTGFSPESCKELINNLDKLIKLLDEKETLTQYSIMKELDILKSLFKLLEIPIETRVYFFNDGLPPKYMKILYSWMTGKYLDIIAKYYFKGSKSEAMVKVQGLLSGYSAWFLYAISVLIKYMRPKAKYLFSLEILPSYAWYGTDDPKAISILERDISKNLLRDDVLKFVKEFNEDFVKKIPKEPSLNLWEKISEEDKKRLISLKLNTDEQEFLDELHSVLRE